MKKTFASLIFASLLVAQVLCAQTSEGFKNPVLPGFHPDPSVCRVGQDYYLVNSSFQYFPGVPIHHSTDLVHWEPIGYCLSRPEQLDLTGANFWLGIYAPTIRYIDDTFYMIVTNVPKPGQILVHASDPKGPWSDPVIIDAPGIDPDLFVDSGKCYVSTSYNDAIYQCQIDLATGKRLTDPKPIWNGTGGRYPEAPHIYKKDGWYYLLIAEGGTEYGHKVTMARSRWVEGPYEGNPANPILTHINRNAESNLIQGTGHADLVQAHDGSWWLSCLAFRIQGGTHHLLGRETYMAPVEWGSNAWPVVNGNGTIAVDMQVPTLPQSASPVQPKRTDFSSRELGLEWNYVCNPVLANYSLSDRKGYLRLKATGVQLDDAGSPSFVGRRLEHMDFESSTLLDASRLVDGAEAGMSLYMGNTGHHDLKVVKRDGRLFLQVTYRMGQIKHIEQDLPLSAAKVYLRLSGDPENFYFAYSVDGKNFKRLAQVDTRFLSTETVGGFTGMYIGLFAQQPAQSSTVSYADFDWFDYQALK